ncbi:MAG: M28 family peptidase [Promethearchaeia archaeon]
MNKEKSSSCVEEQLFNYVKEFSFPRLAGTEGEKKAVEKVYRTFKEIGYEEDQIEKEPFEFSDFYSTTLVKFIMLLSFNVILILIFLLYIFYFFTFFIIGVMVIIMTLILRALKHPEKMGFWGEYFGDILEATNVFTKIPAKKLTEQEAGDIIISAHLDSKSQTFKTSWRIVFYRIWLFSGILLGGFYIASLLINLNIFPIPRISIQFWDIEIFILDLGIIGLTLLILISNVFLMFLNTHNKSPGACDNGSGMAIVFALSQFFLDHPLDHFNLWFCQFSAEELGTMGSRIFVNNHDDKFTKGRIFQINFDMISAANLRPKKNRVEYLKSYGIFPRKKIAPLLSKYLDEAAKHEGLEIHGFHLTTGAHTDSVPFHLRGYSSVDIVTRHAARYAHDEIDTPDKVDPKVLKTACSIGKRAVLNLDRDYHKLCNNELLVCVDNKDGINNS